MKLPFLSLVRLWIACSIVVVGAGRAVAGDREAEPVRGNFRIHHGFKVFYLQIPAGNLTVLVPEIAAEGRPWILGPDNHAYLDMDGPNPPVTANMARTQFELARRGFHVVTMALGNTFGAPEAIAKWDSVYEEVTGRYGLSKQCSLMGLSRGGLSIARWAALHPGKVRCLYLDKAVCDIKSWPGGKLGGGVGSKTDWDLLLKTYGFESEQAAMEWKGNPVDLAAQLARDGVAIVYVAGAADSTVPYAENGAVMERVYRECGGAFKLVWMEREGHHPHGLRDPRPVVDFIVQHAAGALPRPERTAP